MSAKTLDARKALESINEKLLNGDGYYRWASMGTPPVWFLRLPRGDRNEEQWQKREAGDICHICKPLDFLKAQEQDDREALAAASGYVINGECTRCKVTAPEDIEKRFTIQIKMHALGKKVKE